MAQYLLFAGKQHNMFLKPNVLPSPFYLTRQETPISEYNPYKGTSNFQERRVIVKRQAFQAPGIGVDGLSGLRKIYQRVPSSSTDKLWCVFSNLMYVVQLFQCNSFFHTRMYRIKSQNVGNIIEWGQE